MLSRKKEKEKGGGEIRREGARKRGKEKRLIVDEGRCAEGRDYMS